MDYTQRKISEKYRKGIDRVCGIYNKCRSEPEDKVDPGSINWETDLRRDLGMNKIFRARVEKMLQKEYPGIEGFAHEPSIETIGDVINYIEQAPQRKRGNEQQSNTIL